MLPSTAHRVSTLLAGVAVGLVVVATPPRAGAQAALPAPSGSTNVEAILRAYARASGGDAFASLATELVTGTLTRGADGPAPFEAIAKAPGRWRYTQVFAWGDQESFGFDGTRGWVADTRAVGPIDGRQLLEMRLLWDPQAPLRLAALFTVIEPKPHAKAAGGDTSWLVGRSRDGIEIDLGFDRASGLLVQAGRMRFEDYRAIDGIMRPFRVRLGDDMVLAVGQVRHSETVEDSTFSIPACVLPAREPPLYRPEKHVQVSIAAMDACAGEYETPDGRRLHVHRKDNHLFFRSPRASFELLANSETEYVRGYSNMELHFVKDAGGVVTSLELLTPGQRVEAKRVE